MKLFITHEVDGSLFIQARAESVGPRMIGDASFIVHPGSHGDLMGWTYEDLKALGEGEHDIEWKWYYG